MSLLTQSLPPRESSLSNHADSSYTELVQESSQAIFSPHETYDDAIFDDFYDMGEQDVVEPAKTAPAAAEPPPLPTRNALRASRLLDNLALKLAGALESRELGQTTPHDVYLSSEEDGMSSADDFSDYDFESDSEGALSPTRRRSHEDTARVVSFVFVGKPSIIELSCGRRSASPRSSVESRPQSCIETGSSIRSMRRLSTSSGSVSSLSQPPRKSSLLANRPRPPFLNIDPYANGSTYSLELPKEESRPKTPMTPTALLKGVTRTFSLVRKRSRPLLNESAAAPQPQAAEQAPLQIPTVAQPEETEVPETPRTPASPVTYNDIMKAARKNAKTASLNHLQPAVESPTSPVSPGGSRKSFLGGLAARRRSIKIVNGRLL